MTRKLAPMAALLLALLQMGVFRGVRWRQGLEPAQGCLAAALSSRCQAAQPGLCTAEPATVMRSVMQRHNGSSGPTHMSQSMLGQQPNPERCFIESQEHDAAIGPNLAQLAAAYEAVHP